MRKNTLATNSILNFTKASFFLLLLLILGTNECKAQVNSNLHNQNRDEGTMKLLREKWNNAQGTFQIQVVNSRINPQVDVSYIEDIEKSRKQNDIVYLPLMDHVRIMVLPLSTIKSVNFKEIELFKYIQE